MTPRRRAVLVLAGALAFVALGRADAPPGRYTMSNGTVYDTRTRLTWQQSPDAATYSWPDATQYCALLPLAGGGWRLPSAKELPTIIDDARYTPGIDPTAFPGTPAANFWTSTTVRNASTVWFISFDQGDTSPAATTSLFRVRCVR